MYHLKHDIRTCEENNLRHSCLVCKILTTKYKLKFYFVISLCLHLIKNKPE